MIISRAPVRISFFGGGTDHPEFFIKEGGAVLSTAIDKFVYSTVNHFPSHMYDYAIRLSYSSVELAKRVEDIEHNIFRECLKHSDITKDVAIHSAFDTHAFSGLGSSSSLTVSVLQALLSFNKKFLTPKELAQEAIFVEKHRVKSKVGCQDQVAAAFGGFNLIEFKTEKDFTVHRVPLSPEQLADFENHLFLVYTGMVRNASDVTAHQLRRVRQNSPALRAMKAMAFEGYEIITRKKPLEKFGELLNLAWEKKRSLDGGVSNKIIDKMYRKGLNAGAWGGKLLGAGGGGFLLFMAPPKTHRKLTEAFPRHRVLDVKINAPGSQIIFS